MNTEIESLAAALDRDPADPQAWHSYGMALARAGHIGALIALADRAASCFGDALTYFHNVTMDLAGCREWPVLQALAEEVPAARRESALALYYAGCSQVAAGRHAEALEWFGRFKQAVLPRYGVFPLVADGNFNLVFRQGMLVEAPAVVRQLAASASPPRPEVTFDSPPPPTKPPFAVACVLDARYFLRFADELCAGHGSLGLTVPLHFHVVAADEGSFAGMRRLRERYQGLDLHFSHEAAGPWNHPVYYTCARFFVMPDLLERYGCPVVTLDADIVPTVSLAQVAEAARDADFACLETGRTEPASFYQASIMVFSQTPATLAFLGDLVRFVHPKLTLPPVLSWMLDQAALYSVLTQRACDGVDFRFTALDRALGLSLGEATRQLSSDDEKRQIMAGAAIQPKPDGGADQ